MKIRFFAIGLIVFLFPFAASASGYDFYVDGSVEKSGDGSENDPFKTITEAIEAADGSTKIFIESGEYNERIELRDIRLYGKSESRVIISEKIYMYDGSHLEDLTVANVKNPITIQEGANVEIENCTIRDFKDIGINLLPGTDKVSIVNTNIKNGTGKGIYIQRGSYIYLVNSQIIENEEEGVDIRSKITGEIRSNNIENNGESGIEVIAGSADLYITQNVLKGNGSSGVAFQYYPSFSEEGYIKLTQNSIHHNSKYGIDCRIPQGGIPGLEYWRSAVDMDENDIYSNKESAINPYCNMNGELSPLVDSDDENNMIVESGDEDAVEQDSKSKIGVLKSIAKVGVSDAEKIGIINEREKKRKAEREKKINELNFSVKAQGEIVASISQEVDIMKERNFLVKLFFKLNDISVSNYISLLENSQRQLKDSEELLDSVHLNESEELKVKEEIRNGLENVEKQITFFEELG